MNIIQKIFKKETNSFEEFVETVRGRGVLRVTISPTVKLVDGSQSIVVGSIGTFLYLLVVEAKPEKGRTIVFTQEINRRFGSDSGFADAEDRFEHTLSMIMAAESTMRKLRTFLSDVTIEVVNAHDEVLNDLDFQKVRNEATKRGLAS